MDKPIPNFSIELEKPLHIERDIRTESNEGAALKNPTESTPLIDKDKGTDPLLAKPEHDLEGVDGLPVITISHPDGDDEVLDSERDNDAPLISERAGAFPYAPGFGPNITDTVAPGSPESLPDLNIYQHKKTVAQGMMDIALFSANANQLRYVLESPRHPYFYPGIVLISFSLIFQVAVGVGLLWNTQYNVKDEKEVCIANKINNFTIVAIFLVTVINVFICAFGTTAGVS